MSKLYGKGRYATGTYEEPRPPSGGAPSGAAGGDLAGTYPNPSVRAITETDGPTQLLVGAILDNDILRRVGGSLVGGVDVRTISVPVPGGIAIGDDATLVVVNVAAAFPDLDVLDLIMATSPRNMVSFAPDGIPGIVGAEVSSATEITFGVVNYGALPTGAGNLDVVVTRYKALP